MVLVLRGRSLLLLMLLLLLLLVRGVLFLR
jgi:hypothetical protein